MKPENFKSTQTAEFGGDRACSQPTTDSTAKTFVRVEFIYSYVIIFVSKSSINVSSRLVHFLRLARSPSYITNCHEYKNIGTILILKETRLTE